MPAQALPNSSAEKSDVSTASAVPLPRPPRAVVALLFAAGLIWWPLLGWLAVTTANPVTLNREQLLQSQTIVSGEIQDKTQGVVRVTRIWSGLNTPDEITVEGLEALPVHDHQTCILPLTVEGPATFNVTRARLGVGPDRQPILSPPYVYPATESAETKLREFLDARESAR